MHVSLDRTLARLFVVAVALGFSAGLAGCDGWPNPDDGQGGEPPPPQEPPDAGSRCVTLGPIDASDSPEVNGALCYGIALNSSSALRCAAASPEIIECVDVLLGLAYVMQWTGATGIVRDELGQALGSVQRVEPARFEVSIGGGLVEGVCTIESGPPAQALFCLDG